MYQVSEQYPGHVGHVEHIPQAEKKSSRLGGCQPSSSEEGQSEGTEPPGYLLLSCSWLLRLPKLSLVFSLLCMASSSSCLATTPWGRSWTC